MEIKTIQNPDLQELQSVIREVPNYPKPGIMFKDITPLLASPRCTKIALNYMLDNLNTIKTDFAIDAIAGIESRGFLFGMMMAKELGVSFIPIRKEGKLPFHKVSRSYDLEYGKATIEMHTDAVSKGMNVFIHDDLLATAGTACATAELIKGQGANVIGFGFLIELGFLNGRAKLEQHSKNNFALLQY